MLCVFAGSKKNAYIMFASFSLKQLKLWEVFWYKIFITAIFILCFTQAVIYKNMEQTKYFILQKNPKLKSFTQVFQSKLSPAFRIK
jgi:hypothetical protein